MCVRVFSSICFIFYGSCRQRAHTVFFPFLDLGREICMCLYTSYTAVFVEIHWTNQWKSFSDDLAHFTHMIFPFPLIWDTPRHSTCVDSMVSSILRNIPTYFMWLFIIYLSWFEFEGKASIACIQPNKTGWLLKMQMHRYICSFFMEHSLSRIGNFIQFSNVHMRKQVRYSSYFNLHTIILL